LLIEVILLAGEEDTDQCHKTEPTDKEENDEMDSLPLSPELHPELMASSKSSKSLRQAEIATTHHHASLSAGQI
jgi:hypothetical protein